MTETKTTKFEDLTIQSNFMFKHVMGNKNLCQRFISNVVKCDVVDLEYMVNFLEYIKTQVPNDAYTRELEAEVARLKLDKEVRRKYMVLQAELRDTEIVAFEAGEAKGHAAGLAEGFAEGEAKKSRETAIKMLKKHKPLSEIKEFTDMSEEEIVRLAKENGLEVING